MVDQVGSVDLHDGDSEPAFADQAESQVIVPDPTHPLPAPPALDYVQDLMDDAEPGGGVPGLEDEQEFAEFTTGPDRKPKQEPQAEVPSAEAKSDAAGESEPAQDFTKPKHG